LHSTTLHQAASGNILRNYAGSLPVSSSKTPTALLAHSIHVLLPTPYSTGSLRACVLFDGFVMPTHMRGGGMRHTPQNTKRSEYSTTNKGVPSSPLPELQQLQHGQALLGHDML